MCVFSYLGRSRLRFASNFRGREVPQRSQMAQKRSQKELQVNRIRPKREREIVRKRERDREPYLFSSLLTVLFSISPLSFCASRCLLTLGKPSAGTLQPMSLASESSDRPQTGLQCLKERETEVNDFFSFSLYFSSSLSAVFFSCSLCLSSFLLFLPLIFSSRYHWSSAAEVQRAPIA